MLQGNIIHLMEKNELFGNEYNLWRILRVHKLEKNLGSNWFKDKKILEVGCSFGNIGLYLESLGAKVTFSDANEECIQKVLSKNKNANVVKLNNENHWEFKEKFDLIINFGLMYNIENWKLDLICSINNSKILALETAVAKYSTEAEFKIENWNYTHPLYGPYGKKGSLVSSANIENIFKQNNLIYRRYDEEDLNLNFGPVVYDWKEVYSENIKNEVLNSWWDNNHCLGRRFWIAVHVNS